MTLTAAEILQILFHKVRKSSVPCEEIGCVMDVVRVVDVRSRILIETTLDSRIVGRLPRCHGLRLQGLQAGYSVSEALPRGFR